MFVKLAQRPVLFTANGYSYGGKPYDSLERISKNGKKVELAVKNVIHNEPVLNKDALANPEALDLYKNLKELQS